MRRKIISPDEISKPIIGSTDSESMSIERLSRDLEFSATLSGSAFRFRSTWGLFSPRNIDDGTELLLDYLDISTDANCIDLGCGYGPLGLVLARLAPDGVTHLIDKDFVAVEYAAQNAELNGISNVEVYLSNGFSHVSRDATFDVVVSNLPAKAGKELYYLYFLEARRRMTDGAEFSVVTVNGLRGFIKRVFNELFGNYSKLKQGKNYTVASAKKLPGSSG